MYYVYVCMYVCVYRQIGICYTQIYINTYMSLSVHIYIYVGVYTTHPSQAYIAM